MSSNAMQEVQDLLARAVNIVSRITMQNRKSQLDNALKLIHEAQATKARGVGPILKRVERELYSALSFVEENPKTPKTFSYTELRKAQADLAKLSSEAEAVKKAKDEGGEPEDYLGTATSFAEHLIRHSSGEEHNPTVGNQPFAVARVPLVIISDPPMNPVVVKQTSIGPDYDNVAGYSVLHNQIVIGVSTKRSFVDKKGNRIIRGLEKASYIADILKKTKGISLQPVADSGVRHNDGVWYWFADQKTINAIYRSAKNHLNITSWGFASPTA